MTLSESGCGDAEDCNCEGQATPSCRERQESCSLSSLSVDIRGWRQLLCSARRRLEVVMRCLVSRGLMDHLAGAAIKAATLAVAAQGAAGFWAGGAIV